MTDNTPYPTRSIPYSRVNLPPSEPDALARVAELERDISVIEEQLARADPRAFALVDDYGDWRKRASSAIGHKKRELEFVGRWLETRRQEQERNEVRAREKAEQTRAIQLAEKRASEFVAWYRPTYSHTTLPANKQAANERLNELFLLQQQVLTSFADVKSVWTDQGFNPVGIAPSLHETWSQIKVEVRDLRSYLNQSDGPSPEEIRKVQAEAIRKVQERAREIANELECEYQTKYTDKVCPESYDAAAQRMAELNVIRGKMMAGFTELTELCTRHSIGAIKMPSAKRPLQKLQTRLGTETAVIREAMRKHRTVADAWTLTLCKALKRATDGGFVLSDQERRIMDRVLSNAPDRETI